MNLNDDHIQFLKQAFWHNQQAPTEPFLAYALTGIPNNGAWWNNITAALVAGGMLLSPEPGRHALTELGVQTAKAFIHRDDANENAALLREIDKAALGRTSVVIDASKAAAKAKSNRARELLGWLHTGGLIAIQTPNGVTPILVKLTAEGRNAVAQERTPFAYWIANNQTIGAILGGVLGAVTTSILSDTPIRTISGFVVGLAIGAMALVVLQQTSLRLRWKFVLWTVGGAISALFFVWVTRG